MAYTDITRAVRLAQDYENYKQWLNLSTEGRQTAFEAINNPANSVKVARVKGYVAPFGAQGASIIYVPAKLISSTQAGRGGALALTLRGIVGEFTKPTVTGADFVVSGVKNFKPAKLTIVQRVSTSTTKESSRITKRKYYRHENDSVTANFGKKIVGDSFDDVITAIKAKAEFNGLFTGSENATASRYYFKAEQI